jgi:hypothetical protein
MVKPAGRDNRTVSNARPRRERHKLREHAETQQKHEQLELDYSLYDLPAGLASPTFDADDTYGSPTYLASGDSPRSVLTIHPWIYCFFLVRYMHLAKMSRCTPTPWGPSWICFNLSSMDCPDPAPLLEPGVQAGWRRSWRRHSAF